MSGNKEAYDSEKILIKLNNYYFGETGRIPVESRIRLNLSPITWLTTVSGGMQNFLLEKSPYNFQGLSDIHHEFTEYAREAISEKSPLKLTDLNEANIILSRFLKARLVHLY